MSWKQIFKDGNDYNEKSIIGFCAFVVMVVVMLADIITGWTGNDLVINEAIQFICNGSIRLFWYCRLGKICREK